MTQKTAKWAAFCLFTLIGLLWGIRPAWAVLEDPFERRVLLPVDGKAYASGLCPNGRPAPAWGEIQNFSAWRSDETRIASQKLALKAADHVYTMPDLEGSMNGMALVAGISQYLTKMPEGYQHYAAVADPETGMKYALYEPKDLSSPWILAVAGTQSLLDAVADMNLGRSQLLQFTRVLDVFTTCQYLDRSKAPLASRPLVITGHSLGGGLAQALAYKIQKIRLAKGLTPMQLDLVTFNAFGAQELIAKDEAYQPEVARYLRAANYFVNGDAVSMIGTHIGPTYILLDKGEATEPKSKLFPPGNAFRAHLMMTINKLYFFSSLTGSFFDQPSRMDPPEKMALNVLVKLGPIFKSLPATVAALREDEVVQILSDASRAARLVGYSTPSAQNTVLFLERMIFARLMSLEKRKDPDLRKQIEALKEAWSKIKALKREP